MAAVLRTRLSLMPPPSGALLGPPDPVVSRLFQTSARIYSSGPSLNVPVPIGVRRGIGGSVTDAHVALDGVRDTGCTSNVSLFLSF